MQEYSYKKQNKKHKKQTTVFINTTTQKRIMNYQSQLLLLIKFLRIVMSEFIVSFLGPLINYIYTVWLCTETCADQLIDLIRQDRKITPRTSTSYRGPPGRALLRPGVVPSSLFSSIISSIAEHIRNTSALLVSCKWPPMNNSSRM